jgi:hypothetical protein
MKTFSDENLEEDVKKCIKYLEKTNYKSYDVFDTLNSPFLDYLLKDKILLRRIAIQLNAKSPINFRPLLGVKRVVHTKTISDLLSIYSLLFKNTGKEEYVLKANEMFELLWERRIQIEEGFGWGLNFPYTTRFTNAEKKTPNLYNTINATHSILDYFETFHSIEIKEIISGVLLFVFNHLGIVDEDETTSWLRYYPQQSGMPTPNVNASSASLFVRINSLIQNTIDRDLISKLLNFVKKSQNGDGSWYYTTNPSGEWIDGFHTGFILESLALIKAIDSSYDASDALEKGSNYFLTYLIDSNNIPKYFNNSTYPIESQNCAQCIQTVAKLIIYVDQNLQHKLHDIISVVKNNLYDEKGYFYHKKEKFYSCRHYYARWSQTPMILSFLYSLEAFKK